MTALKTAPARHPEIRDVTGLAGPSRTPVRPRVPPSSCRTGTPSIAESRAADLLRLSRACRIAAGAYLVEASAVGARERHPTAESADLAATAMQLEQAAQELARAAQDGRLGDPRLIAVAAHLALGGDFMLLPAPAAGPVVVGEPQDAAPSDPGLPAPERGGWFLRRLFGRTA